MANNVIERPIVPYNPSTANIKNRDKYNLYAPVADINKVGMAGFTPDDFDVKSQVVYIKSNVRNLIDNAVQKFGVASVTQVYVAQENTGNTIPVELSMEAKPYVVAQRDGNGNLKGNEPLFSNDLATKLYVDNKVINAEGNIIVEVDYDNPGSVSAEVLELMKIAPQRIIFRVTGYRNFPNDFDFYFANSYMSNDPSCIYRYTNLQNDTGPQRVQAGHLKVQLNTGKISALEIYATHIPNRIMSFLNSTNYELYIGLMADNATISNVMVDLPLEEMVVDADYDEDTKSLVIKLKNGNTTTVPLGDLVEGLVNQLPVSSQTRVYVQSGGTSNIVGVELTTAAVADSIPQRDDVGNIRVGTPRYNDDAVSKQYVDNIANNKLDKRSGTEFVYSQDGAGNPSGIRYSVNYDAWSIAQRNARGSVSVPTPINNADAVNKQYVDSEMSAHGVKAPIEVVANLPDLTDAEYAKHMIYLSRADANNLFYIVKNNTYVQHSETTFGITDITMDVPISLCPTKDGIVSLCSKDFSPVPRSQLYFKVINDDKNLQFNEITFGYIVVAHDRPYTYVKSENALYFFPYYRSDGVEIQASIVKYDLTTNTFTHLARATFVPDGFAVDDSNHIIYCIGGKEENNNSRFTDSIRRYDIVTNTWTLVREGSEDLSFLAATFAEYKGEMCICTLVSSNAIVAPIYYRASNYEQILPGPISPQMSDVRATFTDGAEFAILQYYNVSGTQELHFCSSEGDIISSSDVNITAMASKDSFSLAYYDNVLYVFATHTSLGQIKTKAYGKTYKYRVITATDY